MYIEANAKEAKVGADCTVFEISKVEIKAKTVEKLINLVADAEYRFVPLIGLLFWIS